MINDIIDDLEDLHRQATTERSHYYTGQLIRRAMTEIRQLRAVVDVYRQTIELMEGRGYDRKKAGPANPGRDPGLPEGGRNKPD